MSKVTSMKYSLVIPVYNRAKMLPRFFKALRALDIDELQLIIVDNASSDSSLALCRDFCQSLQSHRGWQVSVLSQIQPGAAAARQMGLEYATGEWVYFFDCDDIISSEFFSDIDDFLNASDRELDMICVPVTMVFVDGRQKVRDYECTDDPAVHAVTGMLATENMLIRRDFILGNGGWNPKLRRGDDWELGLRILLASPRLEWMVKRSYHQIIIHSESMSGKSFTEDWKSITNVIEAAYQDVLCVKDVACRKRVSQALASKTLLVAARFYREGNRDLYKLFKHRAKLMIDSHSHCMGHTMSLLCWLSAIGVPGIWRCYRKLLVK